MIRPDDDVRACQALAANAFYDLVADDAERNGLAAMPSFLVAELAEFPLGAFGSDPGRDPDVEVAVQVCKAGGEPDQASLTSRWPC